MQYPLPHTLLFLELHISYCSPIDIKAEIVVYDHKWCERRWFYWINLHCTTSSH